MNLREQIEFFEGRRHAAYPDPLTGGAPWTIGVGHTGPEVHQGLVWTDEQIDAALDDDIAAAEARLDAEHPWWRQMNEPRQAVLANMAFQMGENGVDHFINTLLYMRGGAYEQSARGIESSLWAKQTPARAAALAKQLRTGEWA